VGLNDGGLPDGGQLKNGLNGGAAAIRTAEAEAAFRQCSSHDGSVKNPISALRFILKSLRCTLRCSSLFTIRAPYLGVFTKSSNFELLTSPSSHNLRKFDQRWKHSVQWYLSALLSAF
jgi:hypothetical protein